MKSAMRKQHYVFFLRDILPQPLAHIVQMIHLANAAANLGHSAVLVYLDRSLQAWNPFKLISPFHPRKPDENLIDYYHIESNLRVVPLPMPWPIDYVNNSLLNSSTITCKYYLPFHLLHNTKMVHSRDWNFIKAAVKNGIPAIYERDHYENKLYEPEIVNNPLFKMTVTVADTIKADLIKNGMPPQKVIKLHNAFNRLFFTRHNQAALEWRRKLLVNGHKHLVVYSGALYPFKGIDLLLQVAQKMPQVLFAFAGGPDEQIQAYQNKVRETGVSNVTLLGYLPHTDLASLLQGADVLVYPHLMGEAANTTSPMKIFDYIAAGKPIVATKIPTLQEFQSSPLVAGWCEPNDPVGFTQSLQQVLSTYPQWREDHINDTDLVQQFSWENRIVQTLNSVNSLESIVTSGNNFCKSPNS